MYTNTKYGGKLHVFGIGEYDCVKFGDMRLHD
jgi:hypothetical protein